MDWYWYVLISVMVLAGFLLIPGRSSAFWKLAAKHPEAALRFFENDQENWIVFYERPPEGYRSVAPRATWTGPFTLWPPSLRNPVVVFGRYPHLEASQARFIAMMQKR